MVRIFVLVAGIGEVRVESGEVGFWYCSMVIHR